MEKKGTLNKILAVLGALVVIGGAIVAIIHFWEEIKAKLPCCCKKNEFEDFEDFMEEELDEPEEAAEEIQDDMADFVEFEEI